MRLWRIVTGRHPSRVASAHAQAFGKAWIQEGRTALLVVPSIVTAGRDLNVVVNPDHPESRRISVEPEAQVVLDRRLFGG